MNQEIPILIDPSLGLSAAALKTAWERDPEAQELGRLEERADKQFTGMVELVVIPILVSVASSLISEVLKRLLPSEKKEIVFIVVQQLPDGQVAVVVQKKPPEQST